MKDRKPKVDSNETASRVRHIRERMSKLDWSPAVREELARAWNVTPHRVSELGAEASRSLRYDDPSEVAQLRASLTAALEQVVQHGLTDRSATTNQLDLRATSEAILLLAKFTGCAPLDAEPAQQAPVQINITSEVAKAFRSDDHEKILGALDRIAATMPDNQQICPRCAGAGRINIDGTPLLPPHDPEEQTH